MSANALIVHGGAPTAVINASLYGAVCQGKEHPEIGKFYAALGGMRAVLEERFLDLKTVSQEQLELLPYTPASAIGTSRDPMEREDYEAVARVIARHQIRYVFFNGGNGSMDACGKIYQACRDLGVEVQVVGIPKTIDNDLAVTDHCPGFGSAAKFAAASALETAQDAAALPIHVVVMEMMGRNAGWITAASALFTHLMPCEHLVYLPETAFDKEEFLAAVRERWARGRGLLVTISEGLHYADGSPVADSGVVDGFGHKVPGGAAQTLSDMIMAETGLKSRSEKPGLLGRTSVALMSEVDRAEAELAGAQAVKSAVEGQTGFMVGFTAAREPEYSCETMLIPLEQVANAEKTFPLEWITPGGVSDEFRAYCLPLIGEYDTRFVSLR